MLVTLGILVITLVVAYMLFVRFHPGFGGDLSKELETVYAASPNFRDGKFINVKPDVPEKTDFGKIFSISKKFFFTKTPNGSPQRDIEVQKVDSIALANYTGVPRLVWFGHSAFLLQMAGKNILIDPMFGKVAAPHEWLGTNRFNAEMPIAIAQIPAIDAVLISHDHYDHLDYPSIKKLATKVKKFYVPLGVGVHLQAWGIAKNRIIELDWWQETNLDDLVFACTPAQHFSGRKFSNGQSTLWSSWVIKSKDHRLFFSGDSGYGPHFKEIGNAYGPFDLAMMECGQYNAMWPDIHMFPEETAQAALDAKAVQMMPIHWGGFKLALHSWTDPIERVLVKAKELDVPVATPRIGEFITLTEKMPSESWWTGY